MSNTALNAPRTTRPPARVAVVGFHSPHHDAESGYEQFYHELSVDYVDIGVGIRRRWPLVGTLYGRLRTELSILRRLRRARLVHFIYPEAHLMILPSLLGKTCSVVTLHLPIAWYRGGGLRRFSPLWFVNRGILRQVKQCRGIILLDALEIDDWRAAIPHAEVAVIPHGVVDHGSRFLSVPSPAERAGVIVVGQNYRDWKTLEEVVQLACERRPELRFHLVGCRALAETLAKRFDNVIAHPYLPHEEFMALFSSVAVHFLPVTFASANNALLEAHSLGIPSVMTRTGGAKTYAVETTRLFDDASTAFAEIEAFVDAPDVAKIRRDTRAGGQRFFWSDVAASLDAFYERVMA